MLAQLRTYTINKGMMDKWLELFYDELVPRVIEAGMGIPTVAVNHENTKFIWILWKLYIRYRFTIIRFSFFQILYYAFFWAVIISIYLAYN